MAAVPDVSTRDRLTAFWPLFGLRLATPRLTLAVLADDDLPDLVPTILGGVHEPDRMPFSAPWTDAPAEDLARNSLAHFWTTRGATTPQAWTLHFVVRIDGAAVGLQDVRGRDFAVTRTVSTGSWLGLAHQGQGVGTEMRAAVLQFAFDHLRAVRAESGAFLDNPSSLRVSQKLGYQPNGIDRVVRRGEAAGQQRLVVTPETFVRPDWTVSVSGWDACRALLSA